MKKKADEKKNVQETAVTGERSARAVSRFLRISPRKVRVILDAIRRKPAHEALRILFTLNKKAARMTEKVLKSAVANAKVLGLDENRLYVSRVQADGGPVMKRFMSRSMGRADRILKRMTHLSVVVVEGRNEWKAPAGIQAMEESLESPKAGKKKSASGKKAAGSAA